MQRELTERQWATLGQVYASMGEHLQGSRILNPDPTNNAYDAIFNQTYQSIGNPNWFTREIFNHIYTNTAIGGNRLDGGDQAERDLFRPYIDQIPERQG